MRSTDKNLMISTANTKDIESKAEKNHKDKSIGNEKNTDNDLSNISNIDTTPEVEISLSELVHRDDDTKANQTVGKINELLADYCTATNLNFITLKNITSNSLNRSRLQILLIYFSQQLY